MLSQSGGELGGPSPRWPASWGRRTDGAAPMYGLGEATALTERATPGARVDRPGPR